MPVRMLPEPPSLSPQRFAELDRAIQSGHGDQPGYLPRSERKKLRIAETARRMQINGGRLSTRPHDKAEPIQPPPFVRGIIAYVCREHATTPGQVLNGDQHRNVATARRQIINAIAKDPRGFSTTTIGRWLNLHHTTVLYAISHAGKPAYESTITAERRTRFSVLPSAASWPDQPDESGCWAI